MQNVLISEVPPAAAGRGGPEMIFFCTNDLLLYVQKSDSYIELAGSKYTARELYNHKARRP